MGFGGLRSTWRRVPQDANHGLTFSEGCEKDLRSFTSSSPLRKIVEGRDEVTKSALLHKRCTAWFFLALVLQFKIQGKSKHFSLKRWPMKNLIRVFLILLLLTPVTSRAESHGPGGLFGGGRAIAPQGKKKKKGKAGVGKKKGGKKGKKGKKK